MPETEDSQKEEQKKQKAAKPVEKVSSEVSKSQQKSPETKPKQEQPKYNKMTDEKISQIIKTAEEASAQGDDSLVRKLNEVIPDHPAVKEMNERQRSKKETSEESLKSKVENAELREKVTLMTDEEGNSYVFTKRKAYVERGDENEFPGEHWDIEVKDQNGDTVATAYSTLTEDGKTFVFDAVSGETLEEGSTKGTFNKLWDLRQKIATASGAEEISAEFVNPRLQKIMERRYGYKKGDDGVHRRRITEEDKKAGRIKTTSEVKKDQSNNEGNKGKEDDSKSGEQRETDKKKEQLKKSEKAITKIVNQEKRVVRRDRHERQILRAIQEYVDGYSSEDDLKGVIQEKIAGWQGTLRKGMQSGTVGEAFVSLIKKGIIEKLPTFSRGFLSESERSIKEEELEHGVKRLTVGVELPVHDEEQVYNTQLRIMVPSKSILKYLIDSLRKKEKESAMRRSKTIRRKEILEKKIWELEQKEKAQEEKSTEKDNDSDDEPPPTQTTPPPEPPTDKGPSGGSSGHVHPGRRPTKRQESQARAEQKEKRSITEKVGDKIANFLAIPFRAAAGLNKAIEKDRKEYERKVASRREERNRKGKKAQEERGKALNEAIRKGSVAGVAKVAGDNWGVLARYFAQQAAGKASQKIKEGVQETVRQAVSGPQGSEEEPDDIYETGGNPWDDFVEAMKKAGVISDSGQSSETSSGDSYAEEEPEESWYREWGILEGESQRTAREELIKKETKERKSGPTLAQKWGIVDMPEEYKTQNPNDRGGESESEEPWYREWGILEGESQRAAREELIKKEAEEGWYKKNHGKEPQEGATLSDWFWGRGKYGPPEEKEPTSKSGTSSRSSGEKSQQPRKKQRRDKESGPQQKSKTNQPGGRAMTSEEYKRYKEQRQGTGDKPESEGGRVSGGKAGGETGFVNEYEDYYPEKSRRPTHYAPVPASTGPKMPPVKESSPPPPEGFVAGLAIEAASRMEQYAEDLAAKGEDPLAPGSGFIETSRGLNDVAQKVANGKNLTGGDRLKIYKAVSNLRDVQPTEDIGKAGMKR